MARVLDTRPQTLGYLESLGLNVGTLIDMLESPSADRLRIVRAAPREIALSEELASQILVEEISGCAK